MLLCARRRTLTKVNGGLQARPLVRRVSGATLRMGRFIYDAESGTSGFTSQELQRLAHIDESGKDGIFSSSGDGVQHTTTNANYIARNENTTQRREPT